MREILIQHARLHAAKHGGNRKIYLDGPVL
jgi:hypothetical protein